MVSLMNQIINKQMNFINQLLENLKKEKLIHLLETRFWGVDLADRESQSTYNKEIKYLLFAIDFFSKYAWVVPIKDKKGTSIANAISKNIK